MILLRKVANATGWSGKEAGAHHCRARLRLFAIAGSLLFSTSLHAQQLSAEQLFYKLRARVTSIKDYTAQVRMNVNVSFMKVPQLTGTLYFKSPDKLKLERTGGLSVLPKGGVTLSMNSLLPEGGVSVIDAGTDVIEGKPVRIIKAVPNGEGAEIVLTKMWVDEGQLLVRRAETTTRDNGTVKMDLTFGRYANLALPDRAVLTVDVKEYRMPKGVTMDYGTSQAIADDKKQAKGKRRKGTIKVEYLNYKVNTGLSDAIFVEAKKRKSS
jgi:outer membrane lipoprotein-sorting protein